MGDESRELASTPDDEDRWLLHARDACSSSGQLGEPPCCPPGLRLFEAKAQASRRLRHATQRRLRALAIIAAVTVVSAHDPGKLSRVEEHPCAPPPEPT